jgi:D-mannonate dehydratase
MEKIMGYRARLMGSKFGIKNDFHEKARQAVIHCQDNFGIDRTQSLEEMVSDWGWHLQFDPSRDIVGIEYESDSMRGDEDMLDALAPFVENGSYLQMNGEEGEIWRWVFKDGKLYSVQAELTFPDPVE